MIKDADASSEGPTVAYLNRAVSLNPTGTGIWLVVGSRSTE
jgi:hypothetical protein